MKLKELFEDPKLKLLFEDNVLDELIWINCLHEIVEDCPGIDGELREGIIKLIQKRKIELSEYEVKYER